MESDTFRGNFMMKLIWRFSGNLIYHVFFKKKQDNLHIGFTIKSL